jgi:beta-aspartyl-peptidase (threonine type)
MRYDPELETFMKTAIAVHGGAGQWKYSADHLERAVTACCDAANAAQVILRAGGPALDAIEAAVRFLEDAPVVDAGKGSYLNAVGEIELDAMIMDGSTMELGAVAAVRGIRNPVSLARYVMFHSRHNFLVAQGAEAFADSINFPRCESNDLITDEQRVIYQEFLLSRDGEIGAFPSNSVEFDEGDTVGAVAIDVDGNLAAATSTGGTKLKEPGRVGDSPLVGSGAYADNLTAAVSATGNGEALMKILISKRVCDFVADGLSTQKACEAAIDVLSERVGGRGGLIAVDRSGRVGIAFNTVAMPYAYYIDDNSLENGK